MPASTFGNRLVKSSTQLHRLGAAVQGQQGTGVIAGCARELETALAQHVVMLDRSLVLIERCSRIPRLLRDAE